MIGIVLYLLLYTVFAWDSRKTIPTLFTRFQLFAKSRQSIDWSSYQKKDGLEFPSQEQCDIIDEVIRGERHVKVNAVAGSGKTTTILHVASLYGENKSIAALLYNSRLKDETRFKKTNLGLDNMEAHSYHAFALKYYLGNSKYNHELLKYIVNDNIPPKRPLSFDLYILDEVQDMTPELYAFICKVLADNTKAFTLLLLGDERQNIYRFRDADHRYLTMANELFNIGTQRQWITKQLTTSFRMSSNIGSFINKNILHFPLFKTVNPPGVKVQYYRGCPYEIAEEIGLQLVDLLRRKIYLPSDIFILMPSTKLGSADKQTPVNKLANYLQKNGFPFYRAPDNDVQIDTSQNVLQGKIVVSTIHKVKGLERKIVVIFDFSRSYYYFYAKKEMQNGVCPNVMYVASTRAKEMLMLVGEKSLSDRFHFLKGIADSEHLQVITCGQLISECNDPIVDKSNPSATQLTKYLPESVRTHAMSYIRTRTINPAEEDIELKGVVETGSSSFEEVFELNGVALPALYERLTTKKPSTIQKFNIKILEAAVLGNLQDNFLVQVYLNESKKSYSSSNISGHLRLAAIYDFATTGFMNKPVQLKKYDWISAAACKKCIEVLSRHLVKPVQYELKLEVMKRFPHPNGKQVTISGRVDAVSQNAIWELKCTRNLDDEHLLQLAVYTWMACKNSQDGRTMIVGKEAFDKPFGALRSYLLNMRTNELVQLDSTFDELECAVTVLVENFIKGETYTNDTDFLAAAKIQRSKAVTLPARNNQISLVAPKNISSSTKVLNKDPVSFKNKVNVKFKTTKKKKEALPEA